MRGTARRRVFGGNAGLWLFQKKFLSKDKESNENRQIFSASSTVKVGNDDHLDHSCIAELRDSIKCSPESTENSSYPSTDNDELVLEKSDIVATSVDVSTTGISHIGKTHKRGVFRARKRHFENNSSDSDSSVAMFSASSQGDNKRHCHGGTLTTGSSVPPSTSNFNLASISSPNHTLSSVELKDAHAVFVDDNDDTVRDREMPNTIIADAANLTQQSESTSVFDFDKDPVTKQLGSKTSLDVARQFFAQLDSDQTLLQIEDVRHGPEPPSTKKKSKVVHTTRGKLPPNVAKREYRKYCQACQSSKIKPFSMDRFLQQRSEYFRVGDVYDGMFDE
jgi:hypothetical protein